MGDAALGVLTVQPLLRSGDAPAETRLSSRRGSATTAPTRRPTSSPVGGWDGMAAIVPQSNFPGESAQCSPGPLLHRAIRYITNTRW